MKNVVKRAAIAVGALGAAGSVLGAVVFGHSTAGAGSPVAAPTATPHSVAPVNPTGTRAGRPAGQPAGRPGKAATFSFDGSGGDQPSTIPVGEIQLCAQGDYPAVLEIHQTSIPGTNMMTAGIGTRGMAPGQCTILSPYTFGQWVDVEIRGYDAANQRWFVVGHRAFNSDYGLGLGAEGTSASPYYWQW